MMLAYTAIATAWNPAANGGVYALSASATTIFAGGRFTSIGGQPRAHLAALARATGMATPWNPGLGSGPTSSIEPSVGALALNDSLLYVGGYFASIGGQSRNNLAAVDATTGAVTAWDPQAGGWVSALAARGGSVYAGGGFAIVGGVRRANLAAIDTITGMASDWNPSSGPSDVASIGVLKMHDTTLYVGGGFTTIDGQSRPGLAAFNTTTGALTAWNPAPNGGIGTLEISGTLAYVGGSFTTIGGQNRTNLAAIDTTTGLANSWDPAGNNFITALAVHGNTVYIGGDFTDGAGASIGGQPRYQLAAVDAISGSATAWEPNKPLAYPTLTGIGALLARGSTVYIGSEQGIYAVDTVVGDHLPAWSAPDLGGSVASLRSQATSDHSRHSALRVSCR